MFGEHSGRSPGCDACVDGAADVSSDVPIVVDAGPVCDACSAPAGFSPVLFSANRATACPTGTVTSDDLADPGAGAGACACSCTISTQPSCYPGVITSSYDTSGGAKCDLTGATLSVPDAGCEVVSGSLGGGHVSLAPSAPVGGKCSNTIEADGSAISTTAARLCTPSSCPTAACTAPSGFLACFAHPGDVACPNGLTKHTVGTAVSPNCTCSACALTVDGGCEGTLALYNSMSCTQLIASAPVDGTCVAEMVPLGTHFSSAQWAASLVGVGCKPGAPSLTSVDLTGATTICCPP